MTTSGDAPAVAGGHRRVGGIAERPWWLFALLGVIGAVALILLGLMLNSFWIGRPGASVTSPYGPVELEAARNPRNLAVGQRPGSMAPDFVLQQPDGSTLRLSDLQGQAVVLNFWATWCPPCRAEMADLQAAADRYAADGVTVVGVNIQEDSGTIAGFMERFRLSFPIVKDVTGTVTSTAYRVNDLPSTFFIGRDGVIREVNFGPMTAQVIEEKLKVARTP